MSDKDHFHEKSIFRYANSEISAKETLRETQEKFVKLRVTYVNVSLRK